MNRLDKGMSRRPFSAIPDVEAFYPSQSAESARERLFRTLDRGEGPALLFGETGLGKTLLLRLLAGQFEINAPVIFPANMRISGRKSFLQQLLFQLRITSSSQDEDELRILFLDYLRSSDYPRFILLIDDGDRFPFSVFDEIRSLLDMESDLSPRFRIALSGSARLEERLNHPRLAAFGQRISSRSWLDPFTRDETVDYIGRQMHRAEADYDGLAFSPEAARRVHKYSEGIPRIMNQICDLSLYLSSTSDRFIPEKTVIKAWSLLQQIPEESVSEERTGCSTGVSSADADDLVSDLRPSFSPSSAPVSSVSSPAVRPSDSGQNSASVIEFGSLSDDETNDDESLESRLSENEAAGSDSLSNNGDSFPSESLDESEVTIDDLSHDNDGDSFPSESSRETPSFSVDFSDGFDDSDRGNPGLNETDCGNEQTSSDIDDETIFLNKENIRLFSQSSETCEEDFSDRGSNDESDDESNDELDDESDELLDEDEMIDETGSDLTYDQMIREKLLKSAPSENSDSSRTLRSDERRSETDGASEAERDVSRNDSASMGIIADRKDRYLEELRLLELEVSQEAELIRKIRGMHSGLESFRMDEGGAFGPPRVEFESKNSESLALKDVMSPIVEDEDMIRQESAPPKESSAEGAKSDRSQKRPAKKRPFLHIFEKIYPEKD